MVKIYLAAGLFSAGERLHNLFLEGCLRDLGYDVILPQREALKFFDGEKFDTAGIVEDCRRSCTEDGVICVANADGSDTDSGTAVEYGMSIVANGQAVVYRTDFRTVPEKELGVNAMFKAKKTAFVYHPCYVTESEQVVPFYKELAQKISDAIVELYREE